MTTVAKDKDGTVHRIVKKTPFKEADCGTQPDGTKRTQFSGSKPVNGCDTCDWDETE